MLRRWIRGLTLCGCVLAAGCGVSASATGVTADFAEDARAAHTYMTSDLIPAIGTARFPLASPRRAHESRSSSRKRPARPTTACGSSSRWSTSSRANYTPNREMAATMNLTSQTIRSMREAALEVATERDTCLSEANNWLNGASTPLHLQVMNEGPCLQQARLALAVLTKNKK